MNNDSKDFLKELVETPSPSGYEHNVQKLVRERIVRWCDSVRTDVMGNVFGTINPHGRPRIMLAGHCDQIGFIVNYITDEGFLHVEPIGGVDPVVATSQRVSIMTASAVVPGVIGRKAIHLMDDEDRKKVPKMHDLYVDIGASSKAEALTLVAYGDAGVFLQPYIELANERALQRKGPRGCRKSARPENRDEWKVVRVLSPSNPPGKGAEKNVVRLSQPNREMPCAPGVAALTRFG